MHTTYYSITSLEHKYINTGCSVVIGGICNKCTFITRYIVQYLCLGALTKKCIILVLMAHHFIFFKTIRVLLKVLYCNAFTCWILIKNFFINVLLVKDWCVILCFFHNLSFTVLVHSTAYLVGPKWESNHLLIIVSNILPY